MTFKEAYYNTSKWQRKIVLISMYHNARLARNRKWKQASTAIYFGISSGLVSESLTLNEKWDLIKDCPSRKAALKKINA